MYVSTCEMEKEVVEGGGDARGHLPYEPRRCHSLRAAAHDAQVAPCQRQVAPQLVPCAAQPLQSKLTRIALQNCGCDGLPEILSQSLCVLHWGRHRIS